jgi:NADH-quinone oxidoreductase subunit B
MTRLQTIPPTAKRAGVPEENLEGTVMTTTLDAALAWGRKNSLWPMPMGLACCAIEMMAIVGARFDVSRFGAEVFRFSPRQADMMIVSGTVTKKMAPAVRMIYDQMPDPKWVIAMGACASSGGMFGTYATVQGVDEILPVDVYVPGCPPRPETLIAAILKVQEIIAQGGRNTGTTERKLRQGTIDPEQALAKPTV